MLECITFVNHFKPEVNGVNLKVSFSERKTNLRNQAFLSCHACQASKQAITANLSPFQFPFYSFYYLSVTKAKLSCQVEFYKEATKPSLFYLKKGRPERKGNHHLIFNFPVTCTSCAVPIAGKRIMSQTNFATRDQTVGFLYIMFNLRLWSLKFSA